MKVGSILVRADAYLTGEPTRRLPLPMERAVLRGPIDGTMDPSLPSITSLQCVDALVSLGFAIADSDARVVKLAGKDGRRVFVRRHCVLAPAELRAILIVASVDRDAFLQALARRGSGTRRGEGDGGERTGASSGVRARDGVMDAVDDLVRKRSR